MEILINAKEIQSRKNCIRFLCNVPILYNIIIILGFFFFPWKKFFFFFFILISICIYCVMRIQPDVFLLLVTVSNIIISLYYVNRLALNWLGWSVCNNNAHVCKYYLKKVSNWPDGSDHIHPCIIQMW